MQEILVSTIVSFVVSSGVLGLHANLRLKKFESVAERKLSAVDDILSKLMPAYRSMQRTTSPLQHGTNDDHKTRIDEAAEEWREYIEVYEINDIYLSDSMAKEMSELNRKVSGSYRQFSLNMRDINRTDLEEWHKTWKSYHGEIEDMINDLKSAIRKEIGSHI